MAIISGFSTLRLRRSTVAAVLMGCALSGLAGTAAARSALDGQRPVQRCGAQADEEGVKGGSQEAFVQKCVDEGETGKPASAKRARWKISRLSAVNMAMVALSVDKKFGLSLYCSRRPNHEIGFSAFMWTPDNWVFKEGQPFVTLDGRTLPIEEGGSEDGIVLNDVLVDNMAAISGGMMDILSTGRLLTVAGANMKGKPFNALFDISGSEPAFADFRRRCDRL